MRLRLARAPVVPVILLLAGALRGGGVAAADAPGIDWPAFLARQDLTWSRVPASWDEGAMLGNGVLGAMVFAGADGRSIAWVLGRTDVTDHRDAPNPLTATPRLPIGRLRLELAGAPGGHARLDLWNAVWRADLQVAGAAARVQSFVHATEPVLVIELDGPASEAATLVFEPDLAINPRLLVRREPIAEGDLNPAPFVLQPGDVHVSVQRRTSGGEYAVAWQELSRGSGSRLVLCSIADSFPENDARHVAAAAVRRAAAAGSQSLLQSHRAWWHAYYPASFLSIPDARLERFYWVQMYKLASAMRADSPVLDNQGPWFRRTPWPAAWWNLNVQLSYWPVYASNRLALGDSLVRFIDTRRDALRANVPARPRNRGDAPRTVSDGDLMAIGRVSGPDGVSPVDLRATWTPASGAFELSNLVWVMHNVWLHWRYSMDDRLFADVLFPVLKASVNYVMAQLEPAPDGSLHLPEAISPEYPVPARDTNYDLALLRWGLTTLTELDGRRGARDPLSARWRATLDRLTPYPIGPDGFMIGRDVPLAVSHRHFSHLLMIYPLRLVTGETPGERALIERSVAHWIGFEGALQGYSFVGASAIASQLGDGDTAARHLHTLVERFVKPNTMYMESGPVIETPLAAAQAIHEMLLQSHGGTIRVFPAVPSAWSRAAFENLRAEGAFLVTAVRASGRTVHVRVTSLAGEPALLRVTRPAASLRATVRARAQRLDPDTWRLHLARGESAELVAPDVVPGERTVTPVASP